MRFLTPLLFIWLIFPPPANAEPELDIALKGGLNAAVLKHDSRVNIYGTSGGAAGYLEWHLSDRLYLAGQLELIYSPRGAKVVSEGEYLGQSRAHYCDLVFGARPEMRFGQMNIYLLLGGGFNFLVSANKENAAGTEQDITGDLHRIDVALLVAAGIALHLPNQELGPFRLGTVFLEARHDIGLIDTDLINGGFKNRTSSLMLGLSFVVGGPPPPARATGTAK